MTNFSPDLKLPELEERITPGLSRVEDRLNECVQGASGLVDSLTAHLAKAGGKRMRPALTLLCAQLGDPVLAVGADVEKAAACMELTHLATLYHDDVMDSAPRRRGAPAAQEVWGNNRAILAGDLLFARASLLMADLGSEAVRDHASTFERLCTGQLNETFGPAQGQDPLDFYLQVLADKTGSLVASSARIGAITAGAHPLVGQAVSVYGEKVGVAFQIADDVLDLVSEGDVSGKTPGTDLREGVDTLPILLLRKEAAAGTLDAAGQQILELLAADLSSDEALAKVVAKLRLHPVLEQTRALARQWADQAVAELDVLDGFAPADGERKYLWDQARAGLVAFANLLVDRLV